MKQNLTAVIYLHRALGMEDILYGGIDWASGVYQGLFYVNGNFPVGEVSRGAKLKNEFQFM